MSELFVEIGEVLKAGPERIPWLGVIAGDRTRDTRLRCAAIDQCARVQGESARPLLMRLSDPSVEDSDEIRETALLALASLSPPTGMSTEQPPARQTGAAPGRSVSGWRSRAMTDPAASVRWLELLEE
jgi:hypothetical protein